MGKDRSRTLYSPSLPIINISFPIMGICLNVISVLTIVSFSCRCIVCLAEYHHEDVLRILPNCGHSFHANCIDIWLQQHSTCPVCRISLREYSEKKRIMQPLFSSALRAHRGPEQFLVHSPNCVYAGQSYHSRTVSRHHAGPVQEDNRGSQSTITEAQESIATMDDEQSELSRSKKDKHMESPSNGQVSQNWLTWSFSNVSL